MIIVFFLLSLSRWMIRRYGFKTVVPNGRSARKLQTFSVRQVRVALFPLFENLPFFNQIQNQIGFCAVIVFNHLRVIKMDLR